MAKVVLTTIEMSTRKLNEIIQQLQNDGHNARAVYLNKTYLIPMIKNKKDKVFIYQSTLENLGVKEELWK